MRCYILLWWLWLQDSKNLLRLPRDHGQDKTGQDISVLTCQEPWSCQHPAPLSRSCDDIMGPTILWMPHPTDSPMSLSWTSYRAPAPWSPHTTLQSQDWKHSPRICSPNSSFQVSMMRENVPWLVEKVGEENGRQWSGPVLDEGQSSGLMTIPGTRQARDS